MPLLNMLGVRVTIGTPMTVRVALGGLLGIAGIVIVFWPELGALAADAKVVRGALFTVIAVVTAAAGSVVAARNAHRGVPVWQGMAFAMSYGAVFSLLLAVIAGRPLSFDWSLSYTASLLYLAVFGSVIAFGGYLTLLGRIGAARAGYIGVMVPIVALLISSVFEGFAWHAPTWLGVGLSIAGNIVMLRRSESH
jgi:drug/metabolite transporter (DMT)-like permease